MSQDKPVLHLMCGKVASGKSTLTAKLGELPNTVVLAEDEWLAGLYGDQMVSISDFVRCSAKLEAVIGPHTVALLRAGVSVVLDFHANTVERRRWMRSIVEASDAEHRLHYLDVPDEVCKARLRARNAKGEHPFAASDEQFEQLSRHFVVPSPEEGLDVVVHRFDGAWSPIEAD
ncbi:ATP-binding protein [Pseudovibrio exalbescens]|uniref:AAA family ATPase n=1 Tax=Pseudovibrio exalbescens TaxID=197461 RepID=UPI0023666BA2|nr:ATP-binding protein [Pseudovibrio exalbescens]MDD7910185.1 ATP-binding protein [Pseudovibrio exalbescens]